MIDSLYCCFYGRDDRTVIEKVIHLYRRGVILEDWMMKFIEKDQTEQVKTLFDYITKLEKLKSKDSFRPFVSSSRLAGETILESSLFDDLVSRSSTLGTSPPVTIEKENSELLKSGELTLTKEFDTAAMHGMILIEPQEEEQELGENVSILTECETMHRTIQSTVEILCENYNIDVYGEYGQLFDSTWKIISRYISDYQDGLSLSCYGAFGMRVVYMLSLRVDLTGSEYSKLYASTMDHAKKWIQSLVITLQSLVEYPALKELVDETRETIPETVGDPQSASLVLSVLSAVGSDIKTGNSSRRVEILEDIIRLYRLIREEKREETFEINPRYKNCYGLLELRLACILVQPIISKPPTNKYLSNNYTDGTSIDACIRMFGIEDWNERIASAFIDACMEKLDDELTLSIRYQANMDKDRPFYSYMSTIHRVCAELKELLTLGEQYVRLKSESSAMDERQLLMVRQMSALSKKYVERLNGFDRSDLLVFIPWVRHIKSLKASKKKEPISIFNRATIHTLRMNKIKRKSTLDAMFEMDGNDFSGWIPEGESATRGLSTEKVVMNEWLTTNNIASKGIGKVRAYQLFTAGEVRLLNAFNEYTLVLFFASMTDCEEAAQCAEQLPANSMTRKGCLLRDDKKTIYRLDSAGKSNNFTLTQFSSRGSNTKDVSTISNYTLIEP